MKSPSVVAQSGIDAITELRSQINAMRLDSWELLYMILSSTATFATVSKIHNVKQIVIKGKSGGNVITRLTLTENGIRCETEGKGMSVELDGISGLVKALWAAA